MLEELGTDKSKCWVSSLGRESTPDLTSDSHIAHHPPSCSWLGSVIGPPATTHYKVQTVTPVSISLQFCGHSCTQKLLLTFWRRWIEKELLQSQANFYLSWKRKDSPNISRSCFNFKSFTHSFFVVSASCVI